MSISESFKASQFEESVIRGMTRLCRQYNGVNLSQGFPDFPAPLMIKEAAKKAIDDDCNQYAITWGTSNLRQAISRKLKHFYNWNVDPEKEITVTCGSTEGMIASLLATLNPDDEVIIFAPFYENYGPDAILADAIPRYVTLHAPDWHLDEAELTAAFNNQTRAIIINTPHNPTGKVFSLKELELIARLCQKWDVLAITDEIYEHILYDGNIHYPLAQIDGMEERTITINGISKTFSVTGWRIGYCIAAETITNGIRKVHDFLTVGAPAPLQEGAAVMMGCADDYYRELTVGYAEKRDFLLQTLEQCGFRCTNPAGAYYIMTDFSQLSRDDDVSFAHQLVKNVGVATVPGSSFYPQNTPPQQLVRFCFCKTAETLKQAADLLLKK
ncbi:MAG: aminotransferase class I/II-fold pyridoxal phosphate-dependent enzyme [Deltaproteobacteria bacterium]|nr:aminotransferase class I/II-fold pyridoxal phosphate-dependent enzyme [Candidatus Tharpellaceae bacterium]